MECTFAPADSDSVAGRPARGVDDRCDRPDAVIRGFRTIIYSSPQVVLPQNRYPAGANVAFHQRMEQAITAIPGVASVAGAEAPYLSGEQLRDDIPAAGEALDASRNQTAPYNAVGVDFFKTLGSRYWPDGRSTNTTPAPRPTWLSSISGWPRRAFRTRIRSASSFWVGVYSGYGDILSTGPLEIVGVCGDTLYEICTKPHRPSCFPTRGKTQVRRLTYMIRTQVAPETIVPALRKVLHAADPRCRWWPCARRRRSTRIRRRTAARLAHVGVRAPRVGAGIGWDLRRHGVLGCAAHQGDRHPNGAWRDPRQILAMVLREAASLSAAATALGVGASLLVTRS